MKKTKEKRLKKNKNTAIKNLDRINGFERTEDKETFTYALITAILFGFFLCKIIFSLQNKMSKIVYFVYIIFLVEWRLIHCVPYIQRNDFSCDLTTEIEPKKTSCFNAKNVDECAELLNCYPEAKYFSFNTFTTNCPCTAYKNRGCYNRHRSFNYYDVYEIPSFGDYTTCDQSWLFDTYFGSINWGVFWIGQIFGVGISGFAIYYLIYKRKQRKKFNELNKIGIITNRTVFKFWSCTECKLYYIL